VDACFFYGIFFYIQEVVQFRCNPWIFNLGALIKLLLFISGPILIAPFVVMKIVDPAALKALPASDGI